MHTESFRTVGWSGGHRVRVQAGLGPAPGKWPWGGAACSVVAPGRAPRPVVGFCRAGVVSPHGEPSAEAAGPSALRLLRNVSAQGLGLSREPLPMSLGSRCHAGQADDRGVRCAVGVAGVRDACALFSFQIYQSWLDKSTPYTAVRWVVTLGLSFIYMIRVYLLQVGVAGPSPGRLHLTA